MSNRRIRTDSQPGETPLRNVRVPDATWEDARLLTRELGTDNSAVMRKRLEDLIADNAELLRKIKRREARKARKSA